MLTKNQYKLLGFVLIFSGGVFYGGLYLLVGRLGGDNLMASVLVMMITFVLIQHLLFNPGWQAWDGRGESVDQTIRTVFKRIRR